jgi:hypothetical protein
MICVVPQDTCNPKQLIKIIKNTRMFHCIITEEPAVVLQSHAGRVTREASDSGVAGRDRAILSNSTFIFKT